MRTARAVLALLSLASALAAQDWRAEVESALQEGAVVHAIQVLETRLEGVPGDGAAQRALARALERFVDEGGSWLAMTDARDAWDRALARAPSDPESLRGACAVRLRLGEYEQAAILAERAIGSAWLDLGRPTAEWLELACRARIGAVRARTYRAAEERAAALAGAWSGLVHARELAPASPELARLAAAFLDSEGLPDRAVELLSRAIEVCALPAAATELHRMLIDLHVRAGIEERLPELYERWASSGTNATLAWFTGYVWRLSGDHLQRELRLREALGAYARAVEWMGVAGTLEAGFQQTAQTIRFQSQVSAAWCELESGALDEAAARLAALLRAEPARRDELDGLGRSLMHALSALGERRVERSDFERAAAEARLVVELVPEDGTWWNNLGFLLRERATQVESGAFPALAQREERAREIYRESWRAYRRAAELRPRDARVVNDAALVQVYHLRDSLGEAESMLERALEVGASELEALGADPDEGLRFPIAQALGDAYLNLGYLYYHVYRQPERSREFFVRSLASDSGDRSELQEYLDAIDGKRVAVDEPDRRAFVSAPRTEPPERADVDWEASLAEARARASAEGRSLIVYYRGRGLGLSVGTLDELVLRPEFTARARGAVLVVCDAHRRTFVDRRRDGRRVSCPQWGRVTCGEHTSACREFEDWYREFDGREPGESAEGLWWLRPGDERPTLIADPRELEALAAPEGEPLGSAPFGAIEASLGGEDGGSEARGLVLTRRLAAREAVERILWEGFRSSPARGYLLAALAEDAHPSSRELLAAAVRQGADPELELAALAVWPSGIELDPVRHALRWSPSAAARAAALGILERRDPLDPELLARAALSGK